MKANESEQLVEGRWRRMRRTAMRAAHLEGVVVNGPNL
jgi:hypothetical protein